MCRAPLEDVRAKQMPANILTPVSAEQLISEEISYFAVASQLQSITLSPTPRSRVRRTKEMLRVFGFTLLRTVAEYIHDANIPDGWYDDGESNDGSESSEDDNDNEDDNEEADNQDDNEESEEEQYDDEQSEQDDQDNGNRSDDEFNYAVRRVARVRDLRESIGN
jgi:phosphopantothenoylcysteine synthetase/decarboxylase